MVGIVSSGFLDLIIVEGRIENDLKAGKIQDTTRASSGKNNNSSNFQEKKEEETNVVMATKGNSHDYHHVSVPYYQVGAVMPNPYQQHAYLMPQAQ